MKTTLLTLALLLSALTAAAQDCSVRLSGRTATLSNGIVTATVGSSGRVESLKWRTHEVLSSNGIYFDYNNPQGNLQPSYSKAEIVKDTKDLVEVRYTDNTSSLHFQLGYVMRKGVNGIYVYVVTEGTESSASSPLVQSRVVTRLSDYFNYGYVTEKMQGEMPSPALMNKVETSGKIQDATFRMPDGSIYTKYDWVNFIAEDSVHGAVDPTFKYGVWQIPCSYEWLNGGPTRQELTVHADTKSEIAMVVMHGQHFAGANQTFAAGDKKIYGPFLIYLNRANTKEQMIADARQQASRQWGEWPFDWFDNDLYPKAAERSEVKGRIRVANSPGADSLQVVLAEPGGDILAQGGKYIYWATTRPDGSFSIPGVRRGSYALYAYALKGDVTALMEQDNIEVDEAVEDLGEIAWAPRRYADELFLIGQNNWRSDGFNMSDSARAYGLWEKVPASLTFTVGESNERTDWYYAQTKTGTWTIVFNSDKAYSGQAHLTFSLAGTTGNTSMQCKLNGVSIGSSFSYKNDAAIYRSATLAGRHQEHVVDFPAWLINKGQNRLTLNLTVSGGNGGLMYDCIKLEAGDEVTTGIADVRCQGAASGDAWYNLQGQRVERPVRGVYIHQGKKVVVK